MILRQVMSDRILNVNLPADGFYLFNRESSAGKTYIAELLKSVEDQKVLVLTYNRDRDFMNLAISKLDDTDLELVIVDRADLYMTSELLSKLYKVSSRCPVVVDLKSTSRFDLRSVRAATVLFDEKEICLM